MIFQVLPKLSYETSRDLKLEKKSQKKQSRFHRTEGQLQEDLKRLDSLEKKISIEEEMNERTIHSRAGDVIVYG